MNRRTFIKNASLAAAAVAATGAVGCVDLTVKMKPPIVAGVDLAVNPATIFVGEVGKTGNKYFWIDESVDPSAFQSAGLNTGGVVVTGRPVFVGEGGK